MRRDKNHKANYWGQVANKMANGQKFDEFLAEEYRRNHLKLLTRWTDVTTSQRILKTDLFAEALCPSRAFLCDILKINRNLIGIDISAEITSQAKARRAQCTTNSAEYINCDVRHLPFVSNSFDLIISDSTLDHFRHENEIVTALSELSRILKPGGTLVITMDNKGNITEPLFRLWISFGLAPFFIGKTYSIRELKHALTAVGLFITDTTAIIHYPRFLTKMGIRLFRKISPSRFDQLIRRGLDLFDSLENNKTKYLTALFIAAKAVKPTDSYILLVVTSS
jgi:ubiquinone/menaquinone biosynthesis C-methylase UbiE